MMQDSSRGHGRGLARGSVESEVAREVVWSPVDRLIHETTRQGPQSVHVDGSRSRTRREWWTGPWSSSVFVRRHLSYVVVEETESTVHIPSSVRVPDASHATHEIRENGGNTNYCRALRRSFAVRSECKLSLPRVARESLMGRHCIAASTREFFPCCVWCRTCDFCLRSSSPFFAIVLVFGEAPGWAPWLLRGTTLAMHDSRQF
jgi:hypothetical protein